MPSRNTPQSGDSGGSESVGNDSLGSGADSGGRFRQRGQTTMDFAIGVAVFLTIMLFIFAFVPGILEPFSLTGDQDTVKSERIATHLVTDGLGNASEPYVLDRYCAVEFFGDSASPAGCRYDGESVPERLRIPAHQQYNVTIEGNITTTGGEEILCWDYGDEALIEQGAGACDPSDDQRLAAGGTPPSDQDTTITSRRVASLNRETVTLRVVLW